MHKIKYTLVDENNNNLLDNYFDEIRILDDFILVKSGNYWGLYGAKNYNQIITPEWQKIIIEEKCLIVIDDDKKRNVYDFCGNVILPSKCDRVNCYNQGIIVTRNLKKAMFSYDGKLILDFEWTRIELYSKCIVAYKGTGNKRCIFDYNGKEIQKQNECKAQNY